MSRVRRSKGFSSVGEKVFLLGKSSSFDERFSVERVFWGPAKVLGLHSSGGDSPEVDGQLTRQGHDRFLAGSGTGFAIGQQRSPAAEPELENGLPPPPVPPYPHGHVNLRRGRGLASFGPLLSLSPNAWISTPQSSRESSLNRGIDSIKNHRAAFATGRTHRSKDVGSDMVSAIRDFRPAAPSAPAPARARIALHPAFIGTP